MKKLIIHRQKQFRSCLVSYWIVYEISREDFIKNFFFTPLRSETMTVHSVARSSPLLKEKIYFR